MSHERDIDYGPIKYTEVPDKWEEEELHRLLYGECFELEDALLDIENTIRDLGR